MRIFGIKNLNFLLDYDATKFDSFVKYAIYISGDGERGQYGGTITLSHAFDYENVRKDYEDRYGHTLIKEKIECLFLKESLRTANLIRQNSIDLGKIFKQNDKLKFLMPIRNLLDCAESNMRTFHKLLFTNIKTDSSFEKILESIIKEFLWFFALQRKYPKRFFCFYENSFNKCLLVNLASFLKVYPDSQWIKTAIYNFQIRKKYKHNLERITVYKNLLKRYLSDYPEVKSKLLTFI